MDVVDCMVGGKRRRKSAKPKVDDIRYRVYYCMVGDQLYTFRAIKHATCIKVGLIFIGFL